jgi:hypothetical protein
MNSLRSFWPDWLVTLQKTGLKTWTSWALDAAGPLNVLGAQMIYLAHPLFSDDDGQMQALAHILEDEDETRAFVTFLREDS